VFAAIRQFISAGENKMTNLRRLTLSIVLGLSTGLVGVAYAQNAAQDKKPESCCAMESCCCKDDSCKMKSGTSMNHAARHKHEDCCGDSCKMMKDGATKSDKHECCGDSCAMKKEGASTAATASNRHECCCGGDSCQTKKIKMGPIKGELHKS
jgi:hypothetical protein